MAVPSTGLTAPVGPARILVTSSAAQTRELAARLAGAAERGDVVALFGPLGAGKTEFVKGFATGLGVASVVNSPSFVLMSEHRGRLPLFHLDLYRLGGADEVLSAGLDDERRAEGVTLVEWAERMGGLLPAGHLAVRIEGSGEDPRRVQLETSAPSYRRYLERAGADRRGR